MSLQAAPMYSYIPAKDVQRARRFYEEKIGLKPKSETAGGIIYQFGDRTACFLYQSDNAGTSKASQAFWQVDDIAREVTELRKRGVQFETYDTPGMDARTGIATDSGAKAAWFKDSEGNIMAIIESEYPPSSA